MEVHYLDNSATTPVLPEAAQAAVELMTEEYGNPSSLHTKGFAARQRVEAARAAVAARLGARPEELHLYQRRHRGQQPGPLRGGPGQKADGEEDRHHRGGARLGPEPLPGAGKAGLSGGVPEARRDRPPAGGGAF